MTDNLITHIRRTSAPIYERVPGAASEPDLTERHASNWVPIVGRDPEFVAWLEDGDRHAYQYGGRTITFDPHQYAAIGMSLEEQRREAYESMRGLVLMLCGVVFLAVIIAIYMQRTGGI